MCLFANRLNKGRLVWPQAQIGAVSLSPVQLSKIAHVTMDKLKTELAYLRRMKFGSASEQLGQAQLLLKGTVAPTAEPGKTASNFRARARSGPANHDREHAHEGVQPT